MLTHQDKCYSSGTAEQAEDLENKIYGAFKKF